MTPAALTYSSIQANRPLEVVIPNAGLPQEEGAESIAFYCNLKISGCKIVLRICLQEHLGTLPTPCIPAARRLATPLKQEQPQQHACCDRGRHIPAVRLQRKNCRPACALGKRARLDGSSAAHATLHAAAAQPPFTRPSSGSRLPLALLRSAMAHRSASTCARGEQRGSLARDEAIHQCLAVHSGDP